jgi:hypothetical protein
MKTIICIPGTWQDSSDLAVSIANKNENEYIFAGRVLLNLSNNQFFEIELCGRDERMRNSFRVAGMVNQLGESFLTQIDEHTMVLYLIGDGGSLEMARSMAEASQAILNAGGIGVKVETAGKAFTKMHWTDLLASGPPGNLYPMFVLDSIVDRAGTVFSCGMHNLGLRDTIVSGETLQDSIDLISVFSYYQIVDKPHIISNQTFSVNTDAPIFRIVDEPKPPYQGNELFENPYGMWRLKPRE